MTRQVRFLDLAAQIGPIRDELDDAIAQVLERADFILGEDVEAFEEEFARYCGVKHCVGVASGTDALTIILDALAIGPGDEVITVPNTFIATALAIANVGAVPVFCDVDPATRNVDPAQAATRVTDRTKAIIAVHLYGLPADMGELAGLARRNGLFLIEDACQAHGATFGGRRTGSLADAAAFSFYAGKNLGCFGDGGAITTDRPEIARAARILRHVGQDGKYNHVRKGYNSRLDSIQAAVLRVKLRRLDVWNARRDRAARLYDELLADTLIQTPPTVAGRLGSNHLYAVEMDNRDWARAHLQRRGIDTLIHYPVPIHLQPAFAELGHRSGDFPNAEASAARVLSLPMYAELAGENIAYVAGALVEACSPLRLAAAV